MKLSELGTHPVVTAGPKETVAAVAARMRDHNVGTVVIVEDRRPIGIVTDRDLALALGTEVVTPQAAVEKVSTRTLHTIVDDAGIYTATRLMRDYEVRRLPVVDPQGHLVGIISLDDVLRYLSSELYNVGEAIRHEAEVK